MQDYRFKVWNSFDVYILTDFFSALSKKYFTCPKLRGRADPCTKRASFFFFSAVIRKNERGAQQTGFTCQNLIKFLMDAFTRYGTDSRGCSTKKNRHPTFILFLKSQTGGGYAQTTFLKKLKKKLFLLYL